MYLSSILHPSIQVLYILLLYMYVWSVIWQNSTSSTELCWGFDPNGCWFDVSSFAENHVESEYLVCNLCCGSRLQKRQGYSFRCCFLSCRETIDLGLPPTCLHDALSQTCIIAIRTGAGFQRARPQVHSPPSCVQLVIQLLYCSRVQTTRFCSVSTLNPAGSCFWRAMNEQWTQRAGNPMSRVFGSFGQLIFYHIMDACIIYIYVCVKVVAWVAALGPCSFVKYNSGVERRETKWAKSRCSSTTAVLL